MLKVLVKSLCVYIVREVGVRGIGICVCMRECILIYVYFCFGLFIFMKLWIFLYVYVLSRLFRVVCVGLIFSCGDYGVELYRRVFRYFLWVLGV